MRKSKSRFGNLHDIEVRKQELRRQIALQEEQLGQDFDAYQDDVDTVKRVWSSLVSIRNFGRKAKNGGSSAISKIAENASGLVGGSKLSTAVTVAGKILLWAWRRKNKK